MIFEHFRANGAYEAVQGLSNLFTFSLQNDDVQDFDVRWDRALLSLSEMPSDMLLEGLYKSKLQSSVQLQPVLALYDQETVRNNGQTNYLRLKTAVKLHIDQMITRNFKVRNDVVERGSVTKSRKVKKAHAERKVESVFQWKAHGQCSKGDSYSFSHGTMASGNSGKGQRPKGRLSSPAPNSKAKTDEGEENPQNIRQRRGGLFGRKERNSMSIQDLQQNRHVNFGILPCVAYMERSVSLDMLRLRKSQRWCKRISCEIEGVYTVGLCISRFSSEKIYSTERRKFGSNHTTKFSRSTWHQIFF